MNIINTRATDELTQVGLRAPCGASRCETSTPARSNQAHADLTAVREFREAFRDHLLMFLSDTRGKSVGMDGPVREKLMDDLSKHLNPDGLISDLIADAFTDAERAAKERVFDVTGEDA